MSFISGSVAGEDRAAEEGVLRVVVARITQWIDLCRALRW